jgi:hypothetical protein
MERIKQCSIEIVTGCVLVKNIGMMQPTKITPEEYILFKNKGGTLRHCDLLVLYADCYKKCQGM